MRRIHLTSLIAASSFVLLPSCDFQAQAKERSFGLAAEYRRDKTTTLDLGGGDYDAVQGQLKGALEMLCGTPAQPRFVLLEEWVDDGYDPNYPTRKAGDDGSGEVSKADIAAGNERVFRLQLKAIAAGEYDRVNPFRGAPRLQESWDTILEEWEFFDAEYKSAMVEWELAKEAWDTHEALSEDELAELGEFYEAPAELDEEPFHQFASEDGEDTPEDVFRDEARDMLVTWYPSFEDSAELYRLECLHCHGTDGAGDGSTARFLHPAPRNYQFGIFKWTALKDKARPRRADLYNIISEGAYTSAMPSFKRFSTAQIEGLVDMVRLLAIRGETERLLAMTIHYDGAGDPLTPELIIETYRDVWGNWSVSAESLIIYEGEVPYPTAESIARGREIFMDAETGNCFSCHGENALGDGASAWEASPAGLDEDGDGEVDMVRIVDDWGAEIIPRNLTTGIFRGGRRPIDIYRRLTAGINGTPMPAVPDILTEDDRWALVHYVLSLSETHDGLGLDSLRQMRGEEGHGGDHDDGHADHGDGHDSHDDHDSDGDHDSDEGH
jgi:mono/diheme cytochrome c family protein